MMRRFVPHQVSFDLVEKISKWNNYLLLTSTLIVILTTVFAKSLPNYQAINDGLNSVNSLFIVTYILLDILGSYLLQKAEAKRRLDFIDNSFDTKLSGNRSENYFTNSMLAPGIHKMAVNCFENSFFSYNISKRMMRSLLLKNSVLIAIFIVAAAMGEKQIVVLLFQLSLPVLLFQQLVKLFLFMTNTETVLENFQTLFNDLKGADHERKTPEILRNVIQYETNISWGSILLSSKVFNRLNPILSTEWDRMKVHYGIESIEKP